MGGSVGVKVAVGVEEGAGVGGSRVSDTTEVSVGSGCGVSEDRGTGVWLGRGVAEGELTVDRGLAAEAGWQATRDIKISRLKMR